MSSADQTPPRWFCRALPIALVGSVLLWAALPPLSVAWLAWIAPVPWLLLIRVPMLPGRRPYRAIYLAGLAFWLMAIHWLRLPHPAVYLGWLALSAYLAFYLPVFVGLSRVAVHRIGLPVWIAAPVVFTGLELARAHLLTGFLMASLAHTQVDWPDFIQISDLFGEYGVDFVMMLTSAAIANAIPLTLLFPQRAGASPPPTTSPPLQGRRSAIAGVAFAVLTLTATLLYGRHQLENATTTANESAPTVRIALIQGNSLADWKTDASKQQQIMQEYVGLSKQAIEKARTTGDGRELDLIVWPETMYRNPLREFEGGFQLPPEVKDSPADIVANDRKMLADLAAYLQTPLLVGIDRVRFLADPATTANSPSYHAYNSAAFVDRTGNIVGTYDKFHLVMFGEYVPFSSWLPFLNKITSLTGSVLAGAGPVALCTDDVCYAPSICYETVIPHVTRQQVRKIAESTKQPGVLINMTNDAWYWGSSELDQHLACGIFRAVETRTPLAIAANSGISAWVDRYGGVQAKSPKQQTDVIIADIELVRVSSVYLRIGDAFAATCLTACVALAMIGWFTCRKPSPTLALQP